MADPKPLLLFPEVTKQPRKKEGPSFGSSMHCPNRVRQRERIGPKFAVLEKEFSKIKASSSFSEFEPEMVLVVEIVGDVAAFNQAVISTEGLEWLGEWEEDDIAATEDFYGLPKELEIGPRFFNKKVTKVTTQKESKALFEELLSGGFIDTKKHVQEGKRPTNSFCSEKEILDLIEIKKEEKKQKEKKKALKGKVFLSMSSERGLRELLSLWKRWQQNETLQKGKTKWRDVFEQLRTIRRWGIEESLKETGMIDRWEDILDPFEESTNFQIEFFYRANENLRKQKERSLQSLIENLGGKLISKVRLDIPFSEFEELEDSEKMEQFTKHFSEGFSSRRLISPAESVNALTIGALHSDQSEDIYFGRHVDLFPIENDFPSPVSRIGHGFRSSVKPEIYFPGGRVLYDSQIKMRKASQKPGQKVAMDARAEGDLDKTFYTHGTSNANALASRAAAKIHDMLMETQKTEHEKIPDELIAVLIKSLLVHGARQDPEIKNIIASATPPGENKRKRHARFMGFGSVDIRRVLSCTDHRATLFAADEIEQDQTHEYRFPLPPSLSGKEVWRKMVITLAWFTPINPRHRNLREAKLSFDPPTQKSSLKMERTDCDHHQVQRGTVQHEILEGKKEISHYRDGDEIVISVTCKKDATERLDDRIPYGLSVTLEVSNEGVIKIYEEIRARVRTKIAAKTGIKS